MDQETSKAIKQGSLDFKCKKILAEVKKPSDLSLGSGHGKLLQNHGDNNLGLKIETTTPVKTSELVHAKCKEGAVELPEKCKMISEVFDRMICSLRLLSIRNKLPTFQNISNQVEILAKRKFSYKHLAQIKYILPETIQIDKILIHDQKTLCMKPEIKVTLRMSDIGSHHGQSPFAALRRIFASRLLDLFKLEPEGFDVPEAELLEHFDHTSETVVSEGLPLASLEKSQTNFVETEPLGESSHLSPSFSRCFSQKSVAAETAKTQLAVSPVNFSSAKSYAVPTEDVDSHHINRESSDPISKSAITNSSFEMSRDHSSASINVYDSPVVKLPLVSKNLAIDTPAQLTPKRSIPSCDNNPKIIDTEKRKTCFAKRSLKFSITEGDENNLDMNESENKGVQNTMLQTVETTISEEENDLVTSALLYKVQKSNCWSVKDHRRTQVSVMDQHISGSLPDLVPVICHIFKSANCSGITKEELVHKIIMNDCDIVDRKDVEEQIELLEKLVPDWICSKLMPSGDLLYNIKKVPDVNTLRAKLISMDQTA